MSPDRHVRTVLPVPDRPALGLTTYDGLGIDPEEHLRMAMARH